MDNWTASAWPILVSAALKSTLVLGAAWIIAGLLRGRSAAARHVVWTACAAALLALPVLSISLPSVHLRAANSILPADAGAPTFRAAASAAAEALTGTPAAQRTSRTPTKRPAATAMDWRSGVVLVWAAGLAIACLQMLTACFALWRARRAARPSEYAQLADTLAHDLGIVDEVRVLETASGMPMTFGVLQPTVFLPACAVQWSEERRRVVLLHELAHVRRGDAATHLMARTALALNWWNPLAWSAWRAFLHERERAADDLVLTAGAEATDYAAHLLEIARTMQSARMTEAAAIPMARASQLEGRLLSILDARTPRAQASGRMGFTAAMLAIAMMAPLAAIRAQTQAEIAALQDVDVTIAAANAQKNRAILDQAAVSYEQLRKFSEAKKLREASLALAEQVNGAQSPEYVTALIGLGDLTRRSGTRMESDEIYQRALALGDRPEAYPALMRLGLGSTDPEKRREYLERARAVGRDGNEIGSAMTWLAHDRENDLADPSYSDSMYRNAIAIETPGSPALALTLELYSQMLNAAGHTTEADAMKERAKLIRRTLVGAAVSSRMMVDLNAFKVGGDVAAPKLKYKLEPEYSDEARSVSIAGTVLLKVVIDVDGMAKNMDVVKGVGFGLDEKAAQAIALWKFQPGTRGGEPVPVQAVIEVNFRLM
ncbi:MAG: TonB family protein [Candidatus Solibacter sp.]|nr:TonB family protein [Candidatus Solibacter sp.]